MIRVISIILFFAYLALLIGIGIRQSKKVNDMESYWMASRGLTSWRIAFCLAASWFGLSSFTGQAGWLYYEGMGSLLYLAIPNFAAIAIMAIVFAKRIRTIPVISQAEMLEMRYDTSIRPPLAIILLIAFGGYGAMEFIAMSYVFETFFGWPGWVGGVLIIVATMLYVNIGGMNTVVITEVIQYCLLACVGIIVAIGGINAAKAMIDGGLADGIAAGTSVYSVPHIPGSDVNWYNPLGFGLGTTLILLLAYLPAWSTEQSPWQRMWMAKDTATAYKGALLGAALNCIVYVTTVLMAIAAFVIIGAPEAQAADFNSELVVYLLMQKVIPQWLWPIILVGFMAAAMSNVSNFATSSASNLSKDIYQRFIRPNASQKEMLTVSRVCIIITLAWAAVVGYIMPSILDAVSTAASLATCGYFVPIVGALYWRRGNAKGAVWSFILGGGSFLLMWILEMTGAWVAPIDKVIIGLVISFAAYIIGSLATKEPTPNQLVAFFKEDAEKYIADWKAQGFPTEPTAESVALVNDGFICEEQGERRNARLVYKVPGVDFSNDEDWKAFVDKLLENKSWCWMAGYDIIYKIVSTDMLENVRLARGYEKDDFILYCEPLDYEVEESKEMIAVAVDDINRVLAS